MIAGNVRGIAMMTLVTLLIEPERRDRANGLVGTTTGVTILATSVISGLLVARDGMFSVLLLTMACWWPGSIHLGLVTVDESRAAEPAPPTALTRRRRAAVRKVDLRAPSAWSAACPGCWR